MVCGIVIFLYGIGKIVCVIVFVIGFVVEVVIVVGVDEVGGVEFI